MYFFPILSVSSSIGFQLGQNTNWQNGCHIQLSLFRAWKVGTRHGDQYHFFNAFFLSACSWAAHIRLSDPVSAHLLSVTAFSFDLASPLFLSGIDHAILPFSMLHVFHSLVLLYFSQQYLFFVVTLQFQSLEVSRCCLQHNQRG